MLSPWLPVVMMTVLDAGREFSLFISTRTPLGTFMYPSSTAMRMTFSMLRPVMPTFRL